MASSCLAQFCSTCGGKEPNFRPQIVKPTVEKSLKYRKLFLHYFLPVVGLMNKICTFSCTIVLLNRAIHLAASFLSLDRPRILPGNRQQCLFQVCHQSTAAVRAYPAKMENKPTWEQSEVTFLRHSTQPASQRMGVGPSTASLLP